METDFFAYSRRKIEKDKEEGHFEAAHNREMALRCFVNFLGKEELSLNELTPELMVKFEEWLNIKGRKQSTTRLYLYQISSIYNIAVKEGIVPKLKLLKGVRVALPAKKKNGDCCQLMNYVECVMPTCLIPYHKLLPVICSSFASTAEASVLQIWQTSRKPTSKDSH